MEALKEKPDLSEGRGVIRIGWGLICCIWCAPRGWSAERVSDEVTAKDPPGTSINRWVVSEPRERQDDWNGVNQKPCPDDPERVHWLLNC